MAVVDGGGQLKLDLCLALKKSLPQTFLVCLGFGTFLRGEGRPRASWLLYYYYCCFISLCSCCRCAPPQSGEHVYTTVVTGLEQSMCVC